MASNRHLGRIVALQTLYEFEFREKAGDASADVKEIMVKNIEPYKDSLGDVEFVDTLVGGVQEQIGDLDEKIQPIAPEWPLDQIAAIDRNILRLGVFELVYLKGVVPPKVAINEAVELAKAFGSDNSSKFVNGVLGTAYRQFVEDNTQDEQSEQPAETGASTAEPEPEPEPEFEAGSGSEEGS